MTTPPQPPQSAASPNTNASHLGHKLVDGASALHAEIMNLHVDDVAIQASLSRHSPSFDNASPSKILAYKLGCRDTRHAAAELAQTRVGEVEAERDGWKREADWLFRVANEYKEKVDSANNWRDILVRIDKKFGCDHVANGPEDADALVRHVDELQAERDILQAQLDSTRAVARSAARDLRDWSAKNGYVAKIDSLATKLQSAIIDTASAWRPTHVHRKGGKYRVLMRGEATSGFYAGNGRVVVYDDEEHHVWVRPACEFDDGRFAPVDAALARTEAGEVGRG